METGYLIYTKHENNTEFWEVAKGTEDDFANRQVLCTERSLDTLAEQCYFRNPDLKGVKKEDLMPLSKQIRVNGAVCRPVIQEDIDYLVAQTVMGKN